MEENDVLPVPTRMPIRSRKQTLEQNNKSLQIAPRQWQFTDPTAPNYGGPTAPRSTMGDIVGLGATYGLVTKPIPTISGAINVLFPDAEGDLFEKVTRGRLKAGRKLAGLGAKYLKTNVLDPIFDQRIANPAKLTEFFETGTGIRTDGGITPQGGGDSFIGGGFGNVQQNKIFQRTYSRSFIKGGGGFDYKDWINNARRTLTNPKYKLETFQTADTQFVKGFFNNQKKVLKPIFLKEYGPWLAKNGIDPDTLELHHIFGVMQSAGLYDGVEHMDEGWRLVTGIMNKHGLFPGAPATKIDKFSNFKYVTKELHDLLHHQFLTKKLGVDGSKFFDERILYNGKKMKRIDIINSGLDGRRAIAEEYAKIVAEGRDLMNDGLLQMEALFSKSGITDTDQLVQVLSKATDKGDIFLGNTKLLLKSVNEELQKIAKDVNWTDAERVAGEKGLQTFGLDNTRMKRKKRYPKK